MTSGKRNSLLMRMSLEELQEIRKLIHSPWNQEWFELHGIDYVRDKLFSKVRANSYEGLADWLRLGGDEPM